MPVVCAAFPAFRLGVARRRDPALDLAAPLILADRIDRGRVVDAGEAAAALGVRPGMTLLQAQAVAPEARTAFDDPAADAAAWAEVLDALDAASPLVEDGGMGRAFIEMHGPSTGSGAGGPALWLRAVRGALAGLDLPVRLGLGPNRFVAAAAAACGDGTVCDGDPAGFLAPLPLALLELDPQTLERLRLLGITTLGGLAALPHGPFVRRFGVEAARWHALAGGRDDRPLRPRPRALRIGRSLYGEGEAGSEDQVLFALRALVAQVVDDLAAAGRRAGRLVLGLECADGETRELAVRVARPTAVAATLFELLRARLEGLTLPAAVVGLRLGAEELAGGGVALSLFAANDPDPDAVGVALARLDAVLGDGSALRARVVDGPRLERRYALEPFALAPPSRGPREEPPPLSAAATVQLRLVAPSPIEVRTDGGAPRFVGNPAQPVVAYAGPWRVDERWWDRRLARDEYDVCLDDGALLRLACEDGGWTVRGVYD